MALTTSERIAALREGGWTDRMHTVHKLRRYGVDSHSWNMLNLMFCLFPDDESLPLVKAIQWHDVPERWVGDSPWPAKYPMTDGQLASTLAIAEKKIEEILEIGISLTDREQEVLKFCDMLELVLWAREEMILGNGHVQGTFNNGVNALCSMSLYDEVASDVKDVLEARSSEDTTWWKEMVHDKCK